MERTVRLEFKNIPDSLVGHWWVICRFLNGAFWYYDAYKTEEEAKKIAERFDNALVMEYFEYDYGTEKQ